MPREAIVRPVYRELHLQSALGHRTSKDYSPDARLLSLPSTVFGSVAAGIVPEFSI